MSDTDKITLKNMLFAGSVGVADWEREVNTAIEADIELYADLRKACKSDSLDDTINYAKLYDLVNQVVKARHHNLLESLAEEIASAVNEEFSCERVVVRVRKPRPPLGGICDHAEIEIERHRANRK